MHQSDSAENTVSKNVGSSSIFDVRQDYDIITHCPNCRECVYD